MALLDPAFPTPGQVVEHGAEVLLDFPEDRFFRYFGMKTT